MTAQQVLLRKQGFFTKNKSLLPRQQACFSVVAMQGLEPRTLRI
jgi:hypothetical protein